MPAIFIFLPLKFLVKKIMSRFYAPPSDIDVKRNKIRISGDEAHHILNVMRLGEADDVVVFDGTGNEYAGFIENIDSRRNALVVKIVTIRRPPGDKSPEITLIQAIPKKRMDIRR